MLGRSNVGKSSLLNALVGRRIAKVSGTPGKTRMVNVYEMQLRGAWDVVADGTQPEPRNAPEATTHHAPRIPGYQQPRTTHHAFYVLDLPGYGYARASHAERRAFRLLIIHVLERPALAGVLWLLDIRRAPSADDRAMRELFADRATHVLAAVTKSDKLPHGQRPARVRELCAALELDQDQVVATSARRGEGIEELRDAIAGLAGAAETR